jgi:hypothetical protein
MGLGLLYEMVLGAVQYDAEVEQWIRLATDQG